MVNTGSEVYTGISDLGNIQSSIGLGLGIIIAVVLIILGGYYMIFNNDDKYYHLSATIVHVECDVRMLYENRKNIPIYKCEMTLNYILNGKTYASTMVVNSRKRYFTGEIVQVAVSKTNSRDVQLDNISSFTIGMILSSCAIVLIGICYLNFYLTHHYKPYAALQGARSVWGIFR